MQPLLYGELVPWYHLIDPLRDHLDEATVYMDALARAVTGSAETLLELGSGAGNNASFFRRRFRCTLTDISEPMLGLSRIENPGCEHIQADMRALRLDRTFDAIMVHDAVMYITSVEDLRAVAETAFVHTRPGGAAVFAPDFVRETFRGESLLHGEDEEEGGARSLRCLEWDWDPDPTDDIIFTEYAFLLRDGATMRAVHDRHVCGMFARATWLGVLEAAGYRVEEMVRPLDEPGDTDLVFLCRRP